MRNLIKLFVCLVVALAAIACSSPATTPSEVATLLYKSLQSGDYERITEYIYIPEDITEEQLEEYRADIDQKFKSADEMIEKSGGITSFNIKSEKYSPSRMWVVLTVETQYGDGMKDISYTSLLKQGDRWCVEF